MWSCSNGRIDITRMLVGDYNENVGMLDTVRAMARFIYFITPLHYLVVIDVVYSLIDFFDFNLSKQLFISIFVHCWLLIWNPFSSISLYSSYWFLCVVVIQQLLCLQALLAERRERDVYLLK